MRTRRTNFTLMRSRRRIVWNWRHYCLGRHYTDQVPRPAVLPFKQQEPQTLFQQENARPHAARLVRGIMHANNVLPWPARSPAITYMWSHLYHKARPVCPYMRCKSSSLGVHWCLVYWLTSGTVWRIKWVSSVYFSLDGWSITKRLLNNWLNPLNWTQYSI